MKRWMMTVMAAVMTMTVCGQRMMDKLDRGLVAVKTNAGVFCSWRILGEEYYDVKYNIYRDGTKLNAEPLSVSNFTDASGTTGSQYTVKAVVRGKEQSQGQTAEVWAQNYLEIMPDHGALTSTYVPNDACCADVDGDGELEILIKFDNASWMNTSYQKAGYNGEYFIIEVYKLNGKKLWWIDLGPNMADFQNNEQNIVAYDWDQDGKAEAVMRASDGTVIHMADGTTQTIGDATKNYLGATNTSQWFVHQGNEYLVYMNGETGKPYQVMEYPLKRLEAGETDLNAAWGDGYGHRSTKHFFGAPYLDGRKPSIFLARGIYTRHKMIAYDVNPATHELTERWHWNNNTAGSPWYAQGYHNYAIADVDWDGRDEICFGSMVIDDNGHGLSTTGLGHGDAQHHGDFNPYVHGHEIFACNEDAPANNYRDATTSKIYYRMTGSDDDGRCMAGNFTNDYPGAMAFSAHDTPISCVTASHIDGLTKNNVTDNFRIYWDGDLLEETHNYSNGKNTAIAIYKYGQGEIDRLTGSMTNNDTKGTPCYQGDLFGDWREEIIARTKDNKIRIYTTTIPTEWRNYTLWHDMQYRNAMVWQMCGYNQPPHVSYFLGELEGITMAPPALTMTGRTEVHNGETIDASFARQDVIMAETNDMTVNLYGPVLNTLIVNTPTWVQGHDDNDNITTEYYTHTLTGTEMGGDMRLVKQGDGILKLDPLAKHYYTGPTDIWAGTIVFGGGLDASPVWMNRFAQLETYPDSWASFTDVKADYGSIIRPGGRNASGSLGIDTLRLGFGAVLEMDLFNNEACDAIGVRKLYVETKDWQYGPAYKAPVFRFVSNLEDGQANIPEGKYEILQANEIIGNLDDIVIEGLDGLVCYLSKETNADGFSRIYLVVQTMRSPLDVKWAGDENNIWNLDKAENFLLPEGTKGTFVTGDNVIFDDNAAQTTVVISGDVSPAGVVFRNEIKDYTLMGEGSIIGKNTSLMKSGAGNLTISNTNKMNGGVFVEGGTLTVSALANADGAEYGALGGIDNKITLSNGGRLAVANTVVTSQMIDIGEGGGIISVPAGKTLTAGGSIIQTGKACVEKEGNGTLSLGYAYLDTLFINQGNVQCSETSSNVHQCKAVIVLNGGALKDPDNIYTYSTNQNTVIVPEGKTSSWTLDSRCYYTGKLLGKGNLTVKVTSVRCQMQGDWSNFEGTLNFQKQKTGSYDPQILWDNAYGLGKAMVTGEFDNGGKHVTIGTLSDQAILTGSGRYYAKHIVSKITKSRSGLKSSYFEVQGSFGVLEDVTITFSGSSALKAGDTVQLWKSNSFQTTSNVVVTLPELPAGLYWDTSELLTKEGRLTVTNVPNGINDARMGQTDGGRIYNLRGMPVTEPLKKGIYIRNGKKVIIK